MADESGVEAAGKGSGIYCTTPIANCEDGNRYGSTCIKHPKFGVVTVRFDSFNTMGAFRSEQEQKADWYSFVRSSVASIEAAAIKEYKA